MVVKDFYCVLRSKRCAFYLYEPHIVLQSSLNIDKIRVRLKYDIKDAKEQS